MSYVRVAGVERISPRMLRITFSGDALASLMEDRPDQQMKLCFPRRGQDVPRLPEPHAEDAYGMRWYEAYLAIPEPERPLMRSFTVRSYDPGPGLMAVDFVLHDGGGPATRWACAAGPGDVVGMVGPSSAYARPLPGTEGLLLAGDASALPAIGTILESLPAGARATVCAEVADAAEEQRFDTAAEVTVRWAHRDRGESLLDAVRSAVLPEGARPPGSRGRPARSGRCAVISSRSADCPGPPSSSAATGGGRSPRTTRPPRRTWRGRGSERPRPERRGRHGRCVERTARPARVWVRFPSSMTKRPSISTCGMPNGRVRGSSNVEPAATVDGSNRTRSAR